MTATSLSPAREQDTFRPRQFVIVFVAVIGYAILLAAVYEWVVAPRFEYLAFVSVHPDPSSIALRAIICGGVSLILPRAMRVPSDFGRLLIFFLITIPSVMIPPFLTQDGGGPALEASIYGVIGFVAFTAVVRLLPSGSLRLLPIPARAAMFILLSVTAVLIVYLGLSYGFSLQFHALTDVYDQREAYSDGGGGTGLVGASVGILQNVLAPTFLIIGLRRRSWILASLSVLISLYIYSITGLKSALIGTVFVAGVYMLTAISRPRNFVRLFSVLAGVFVAIAGLLSSMPGFSILIDLVVRRILVMQGMLAYNYIEIFGTQPPTYLSHTIFGSFSGSPFVGNPSEIVGESLFGRSVHANASVLTDGYVSGKAAGVILAAVAAALFFVLLNTVAATLDRRVSIPLSCMVAYMFTQSGLITALLNHGGVALILMILLTGSAFVPAAQSRRRRGSLQRVEFALD